MGIDRYVYAANDTTWVATFMERIEKQSKGYNAVSLSNYDATGVCVITDGSAFEIAGSMYLCTTDTSITASVATGICYIMATGATATASVAWSTTAPVWRDDLQGYYASAASVVRALGGTYFDGSSYELKWVYNGIGSGPKTRYLNLGIAGWVSDPAQVQFKGSWAQFFAPSGDIGYIQAQFEKEGVIITLQTKCSAYTDGTVATSILCDDGASATTMATTNHSGTGTQTASAITLPIIDETTYHYFIKYDPTTGSSLTIRETRIEWIEMVGR